MKRWHPLLIGMVGVTFCCAKTVMGADSPSVHLTHPTPDGFTVFWESGETDGDPELRIFADEDGSEEVTGSLRREYFPRAVSLFRGLMERPMREAQVAFENAFRGRGLAAVRVTGAAPDTRYFVQVETEDVPLHPAESPLPGIRTAWATGFVVESRQVIVRFPEDSAGAVALLEADGASAPLFAAVGDEVGDRYARFNLDHLIDNETGETLVPDGTLSFTIHFFPGAGTHQTSDSSVDATGGFQVAEGVSREFVVDPGVEVAWFEFEPIPEQMAGQPFAVTVTARTEGGELADTFSGGVSLATGGDLEEGESTASFADGVLEDHLVTIGNTGDFRLTAEDPDSGATGESNEFIVSTDWENWMALNVDPEDREGSLREQRLADPDGSGIPRLMEYAFDLDGSAAGAAVEDGVEEADGEEYLSVSFRRLQYAPDIRYIVLGGDDPDHWEVVDVIHPGSPEWVTAYDDRAVSEADARYLRVGISAGDTFGFWQSGEYGIDALNDPEISDPGADPGDYGVTNLERYALGMSGPDPELERLPSRRTVSENGEEYQEIVFERLPAGEDVRYFVEATSDYPNWETIEEFGPGQPAEQVVRDTEPLPDTGYRIIRVRIESEN